MVKILGKFLGVNSEGEQVYKLLFKDFCSAFNEHKTVFSFVKDGKVSRPSSVRSVILKSDLVSESAKKHTIPKSTWTSYSQSGIRTDVTFKPGYVGKFKYESNGSFIHSKELLLSDDGRYVTHDFRAWGLPNSGRQNLNFDKKTSWRSDYNQDAPCRGPISWKSLADYNAFRF